MSITIEIGGPLAEAINNLAAAIAGAKPDLSVVVASPEACAQLHGTSTEKASTGTKARTKKEVAPEPDPTSGPASSQTAPVTKAATAENVVGDTSSSQAPAGPILKDLQTEILRIAREKGHDAAAALLAQFGARKVSEVKPEDGARLIAAAKEI